MGEEHSKFLFTSGFVHQNTKMMRDTSTLKMQVPFFHDLRLPCHVVFSLLPIAPQRGGNVGVKVRDFRKFVRKFILSPPDVGWSNFVPKEGKGERKSAATSLVAVFLCCWVDFGVEEEPWTWKLKMTPRTSSWKFSTLSVSYIGRWFSPRISFRVKGEVLADLHNIPVWLIFFLFLNTFFTYFEAGSLLFSKSL